MERTKLQIRGADWKMIIKSKNPGTYIYIKPRTPFYKKNIYTYTRIPIPIQEYLWKSPWFTTPDLRKLGCVDIMKNNQDSNRRKIKQEST